MVKIDDIKVADLGYYINLDKRVDRKEHLLQNLEEFNITGVERWPARSDQNSPQLNLINTTFDIYKKFLSTDAETLLILEDDCKFLEPFKKQSEIILSEIYSVDWDLFWLGCVNRKPPIPYKNNCYKVSSPSYAQSYIIKRKMAEDVLKYFENNWNNLNPDELLCLFTYGYDVAKDGFGCGFYDKEQPLDHFKTQYISLCHQYPLSTQYNSYSDLWGHVTNLEEWIPQHHPVSKKILTVTWSYEDSYDIQNTFLYKSFIKNNSSSNFIHIHYNRNDFLELEKEFEDRFGFQYEYLLYKIFLTRDRIKNIETDYLIFADASDVVCLGNINSIELPNSILFSSEINQYPSSMGDWGGLEYSNDERTNKYFLNSGLFIAGKQNYINLLDNVIEEIFPKNLKSLGGDQGAFIYHYLSKHYPEIVLDKEYKLFFNTFSRNHESYINYKFPMFVHDNGWNWGSPRFIEKFNLV